MQHATKYISPQQPVIDKKFWTMVKETEKQFVPSSLRRFDVALTVPPDAERRRLAAVEATQEEEDKKVVVVVEAKDNNNQDEEDENCGGLLRNAIFCMEVSAFVCCIAVPFRSFDTF